MDYKENKVLYSEEILVAHKLVFGQKVVHKEDSMNLV
jgi:hypothetical protein